MAQTDLPTTTILTGTDGHYATIAMVHRLAFPASDVWSIVGDWGNQELGAGFVDRVTISGETVGSMRTLHIGQALGGGSVTERLDARDIVAMRLSYSIMDYGTLPWAGYSGHFIVAATGPHASQVLFEARMIPVGIAANEASAMSVSNMNAYFANLDRILAATSKWGY